MRYGNATRQAREAFNEPQRIATPTENAVRSLDVFAHIDRTGILEQVPHTRLVLRQDP